MLLHHTIETNAVATGATTLDPLIYYSLNAKKNVNGFKVKPMKPKQSVSCINPILTDHHYHHHHHSNHNISKYPVYTKTTLSPTSAALSNVVPLTSDRLVNVETVSIKQQHNKKPLKLYAQTPYYNYYELNLDKNSKKSSSPPTSVSAEFATNKYNNNNNNKSSNNTNDAKLIEHNINNKNKIKYLKQTTEMNKSVQAKRSKSSDPYKIYNDHQYNRLYNQVNYDNTSNNYRKSASRSNYYSPVSLALKPRSKSTRNLSDYIIVKQEEFDINYGQYRSHKLKSYYYNGNNNNKDDADLACSTYSDEKLLKFIKQKFKKPSDADINDEQNRRQKKYNDYDDEFYYDKLKKLKKAQRRRQSPRMMSPPTISPPPPPASSTSKTTFGASNGGTSNPPPPPPPPPLPPDLFNAVDIRGDIMSRLKVKKNIPPETGRTYDAVLDELKAKLEKLKSKDGETLNFFNEKKSTLIEKKLHHENVDEDEPKSTITGELRFVDMLKSVQLKPTKKASNSDNDTTENSYTNETYDKNLDLKLSSTQSDTKLASSLPLASASTTNTNSKQANANKFTEASSNIDVFENIKKNIENNKLKNKANKIMNTANNTTQSINTRLISPPISPIASNATNIINENASNLTYSSRLKPVKQHSTRENSPTTVNNTNTTSFNINSNSFIDNSGNQLNYSINSHASAASISSSAQSSSRQQQQQQQQQSQQHAVYYHQQQQYFEETVEAENEDNSSSPFYLHKMRQEQQQKQSQAFQYEKQNDFENDYTQQNGHNSQYEKHSSNNSIDDEELDDIPVENDQYACNNNNTKNRNVIAFSTKNLFNNKTPSQKYETKQHQYGDNDSFYSIYSTESKESINSNYYNAFINNPAYLTSGKYHQHNNINNSNTKNHHHQHLNVKSSDYYDEYLVDLEVEEREKELKKKLNKINDYTSSQEELINMISEQQLNYLSKHEQELNYNHQQQKQKQQYQRFEQLLSSSASSPYSLNAHNIDIDENYERILNRITQMYNNELNNPSMSENSFIDYY